MEGISDVVKKQLDLWGQQRGEAHKLYASNPKALAKALQKADATFLTSLKNANVNEKVIESFARFTEAVQDSETDAIKALLQATNGRINDLHGLQKDQAQKMMNLQMQPEQAKVGIASFAMTIATILRFFGADDMASQIEDKSKEIMSSVQVKLDPRPVMRVGDDQAMLAEAISKQADMFNHSNARDRAARIAENGKVITQPITAPDVAVSAPAQGRTADASAGTVVTWDSYKKSLKEAGLDDADIKKITPAWMKAAAKGGVADVLDTKTDIDAFTESPSVKGLSQDKQNKIKSVVRQLTPMGAETVAAN